MRNALTSAGLAILLTGSVPAGADVVAAQPPAVDKVVLVVLENQNYDRVIRHPTFLRLADEGLLFTNAHSHYHPSYPNYIGLVAGQVPAAVLARPHRDLPMVMNIDSIADRLSARGKTWRNYAEAYPGGCRLDNELPMKDEPLYVRRHVPFLSFKSIIENPERCASVVTAEQFEIDRRRGALPHFSFYSPDMCHSGHGSKACPFNESGDGSQAAGLNAAADWLNGFVAALRGSASWSRLLLVVTFDEADYLRHSAGAITNKVYTLFLGDMVRPDRFSMRVDHYHILRTIGYVLDTEPVGSEDRERTPITGIWK